MEKTKSHILIIERVLFYALIIGLLITALWIIKPLLLSLLSAFLLAYIFYPLHKSLVAKIKRPTISALIITLTLIFLSISLFSLALTTLTQQSVQFISYLKSGAALTNLQSLLPAGVYENFYSYFKSIMSNVLGLILTTAGDFLLNFPRLLIQLVTLFFIFFISLRDGEKAVRYVREISPFQKETEEKLFNNLELITKAVLVGQVVVGVLQGVVAGLGYFLFSVPNALFLTFLTITVGIIPIVGPWLVWIPVNFYLFSIGRLTAAFLFFVYNILITSWIDNLVRPIFVSQQSKVNSSIILVGMLGGFLVLGVIGLIIGPLILSYVFIILDFYRKDLKASKRNNIR